MNPASLKIWWTRDTALHSYVFCSFLIGIPFAVFNTYVVYQLQIVGYIIGADEQGQPCTTYCIVPWGSTRLDLNSVLLYINALAFGLGGACSLFLCAYSDFWAKKHILVSFFIVCYGVFSIPVYWLQGYNDHDFATLIALYVLFNIVTLILIAVLNIYIPHCMRQNHTDDRVLHRDQNLRPDDATLLSTDAATSTKRRYAFNMSIFGSVAVSIGGVLAYVVTIVLSQTLSGTAAQSSGLIVTTVVGFITIAGSIVTIMGLPALQRRPVSELKDGWTRPIVEFFAPFKGLYLRKNLGALLIAYTVYTDTVFAVASATSQLYVAEIRPDALEFSLYALSQTLIQLILAVVFLWIRPKASVKLETWLVAGYALIIIVPAWGCIGLADVSFGFKKRWEFYVQLVVTNISGTLVNNVFRVTFSEMLPPGNEVRWFGMQLVLSCATIWVNYVASGPLQNATHQLRFPLVLSLVFFIVALGIEVCRMAMPVFTKDKQKWFEYDQAKGEEGVVQERVEIKSTC